MKKTLSKGEYLDSLLRSTKTIFSIKDVALMWGEDNEKTISIRLAKYVKAGKLYRVRRGLYAKDKKYDAFDLATRVYTPSYISFETVLTREGVCFQHYNTIFIASYINRDITVGEQKVRYVRMKDYVLSNTAGIESKDGYSIASKERAFLDRIYVSKDYHFDNLASLHWDTVFAILPIYHNKRLEKKVKEYYSAYVTEKTV